MLHKEIKTISDITILDRLTNPRKEKILKDQSLVVTRTENRIYMKCLDEHRDQFLKRKRNFNIKFEEFKKGLIGKEAFDFELKEEMKPYDIEGVNKEMLVTYGIEDRRKERRKRRERMRRILRGRKEKETLNTQNNSNNGNNNNNNGNNNNGNNNGNFNGNTSFLSVSSFGNLNTFGGDQGGGGGGSLSTLGEIESKSSRVLSRIPSAKQKKRDSKSTEPDFEYITSKNPEIKDKKDLKDNKDILLNLSIKERKTLYTKKTNIPTDLNNQKLKNQNEILTKNLKSSNKKALMSKLGYFITDVDHSDIIIGGKLWLMGRNYLESLEKNVDVLRVKSAMRERDEKRVFEKSGKSVKGRKIGEIELLRRERDVGNSRGVRDGYFEKVFLGDV